MNALSWSEWCLVVVSGLNVLAVLFWLAAQATRPGRIPRAVEREQEAPPTGGDASAELRMAQDIERWRERNGSIAMSGEGVLR